MTIDDKISKGALKKLGLITRVFQRDHAMLLITDYERICEEEKNYLEGSSGHRLSNYEYQTMRAIRYEELINANYPVFMNLKSQLKKGQKMGYQAMKDEDIIQVVKSYYDKAILH